MLSRSKSVESASVVVSIVGGKTGGGGASSARIVTVKGAVDSSVWGWTLTVGAVVVMVTE